jgi:dihydrolipoamide dehydrogenase
MGVVQEKIAGILDAETKGAGVEILYGREGRIEGKGVFVDDELIPAGTVIAATGSRPNIPKVKGIDLPGVYHPHSLASMPSMPRDLVVIGGGIMAAEFAYIFRQFGSKVHLVARSGLLKSLGPKAVGIARKELEGVTIHENTRLLAVNGHDPALENEVPITLRLQEPRLEPVPVGVDERQVPGQHPRR